MKYKNLRNARYFEGQTNRSRLRPSLITFLLVLVLVFGMSVCESAQAEGTFTTGTTSSNVANSSSATGWQDNEDNSRRSVRTQRSGNTITFRYTDEDFLSVQVVGDFNDWVAQDMELDPETNIWSLTLTLDDGKFGYQFLVTDDTETWEAIDPSIAHAKHDEEQGWVTIVKVGDYKSSYRKYDGDDDDDDSRWADKDRWDDGRRDDDDRWDDDDYWDDEDRDQDWHKHYSGSQFVRRELRNTFSRFSDGVAYQRVDGFSLSHMQDLQSREDFGPALKGLFSYGFRSKEWTLGGAFLQPLLRNQRLMLKVQLHSGTDFQRNTRVGDLENSLAAVLFAEDFRDYYHREGIRASMVFYPTGNIRFEGGYESSDYSSLEGRNVWSLAGENFAPNPLINDGTLRSLFGKLSFGGRNNAFVLGYEYAGKDLGGQFDYSLLSAEYRAQMKLSDIQRVDFRVKFASGLSGQMPNQRRFVIGGLGTVRGYYYQTLLVNDSDSPGNVPAELDPNSAAVTFTGGQRMLVANFEYAFTLDSIIDIDFDSWDYDWDEFDSFQAGGTFYVFFDTGMAWENRSADVDLGNLKSSAGAGFRFGDNGPRIDLIKPFDDGGHDLLCQIRLERTF